MSQFLSTVLSILFFSLPFCNSYAIHVCSSRVCTFSSSSNSFSRGDTLICTKDVEECSIDCSGTERNCNNDLEIYSGAYNTVIDCTDKDSCDSGAYIVCGNLHDPPGRTTQSDLTRTHNKCTLNCGESACESTRFHCAGSFKDGCYINANIASKSNTYTSNFKDSALYCQLQNTMQKCVLNCHGSDTCGGKTSIHCASGDCQCNDNSARNSCPYFPTLKPSARPSLSPTLSSTSPTKFPSIFTTKKPTHKPTKIPTQKPTNFPSAKPSKSPTTVSPTTKPSKSPSKAPTFSPTNDSTDENITTTSWPTLSVFHTPTESVSQVLETTDYSDKNVINTNTKSVVTKTSEAKNENVTVSTSEETTQFVYENAQLHGSAMNAQLREIKNSPYTPFVVSGIILLFCGCVFGLIVLYYRITRLRTQLISVQTMSVTKSMRNDSITKSKKNIGSIDSKEIDVTEAKLDESKNRFAENGEVSKQIDVVYNINDGAGDSEENEDIKCAETNIVVRDDDDATDYTSGSQSENTSVAASRKSKCKVKRKSKKNLLFVKKESRVFTNQIKNEAVTANGVTNFKDSKGSYNLIADNETEKKTAASSTTSSASRSSSSSSKLSESKWDENEDESRFSDSPSMSNPQIFENRL